MQSRKWLQSLSCNRPLGCEYGKLTGLRRNHATANIQMVAQINHLLEALNRFFANFLLGNHRLNRSAVTSSKLNEAQATSITQEKHATCNTNLSIGFFASFKLAIKISTNLFDSIRNVKMHWVWLHTLLKHHRALSNAHLHLLWVRKRTKLFIAWINCFIKSSTIIYALSNSLILSEKHLSMLNGVNFIGVICYVIFCGVLCGRHCSIRVSHKRQL
ncbi:Uncharacterised protein [Chlamydia trachomatis]|nr:Uncharacterised protein [Chlamydia trachomatis]